MQKSRPF
nr:hypothetical protein TIFTF001_055407 [Ficus carica]GMN74366.1 hypothetical protein TIFTF001_055409 [Ficus carica]